MKDKSQSENLPDMLRRRRLEKGMSQETLSKLTGISRPLISKAEAGHLTAEVSKRLATFFEIEPAILEEYRLRQKAAKPVTDRRPGRPHGPGRETWRNDASALEQMALAQSWDGVEAAVTVLLKALTAFSKVPYPASDPNEATLRRVLLSLLTDETTSADRREAAEAVIGLVATFWLNRRSESLTSEEMDVTNFIKNGAADTNGRPVQDTPVNPDAGHLDLRDMTRTSYDRLPKTLQRCFRAFAVFKGGWDEEAAEAIYGKGSFEQITELVDSGLITYSLETPAVSGTILGSGSIPDNSDQSGRRYDMLPQIRSFGVERLMEDKLGQLICQRHWTYFLALAEKAKPLLNGPTQGEWLSRLKLDNDNLLSALDECQADDRLRLAGALWYYWMLSGNLGEGRRRLEQALSATPPVSSVYRARALDGAGALAWQQGDYNEATRLVSEGLIAARDIGDVEREGYCLTRLGLIAFSKDNPARNLGLSQEYFQTALSIFNDIRDEVGQASCYANLGIIAAEEYDYDTAETNFILGYTNAVSPLEKGNCLGNLAALNVDRKQFDRARGFLQLALPIFSEHLSYMQLASTFDNLASIAQSERDFLKAARLWGAAETLRNQIGIAAIPINSLASRAATGDQEIVTDFKQAWNEGRDLSLAEAVSYALLCTGTGDGKFSNTNLQELVAQVAQKHEDGD